MRNSIHWRPLWGSLAAVTLTLAIIGPGYARPILPPREEKKKDPPPSIGLEVGGGGLILNSHLADTDPRDRTRQACYSKVFLVRMVKGKTYTMDMVSNQIDSYLRVESPAGNQLAEDDDSGGFPNARIIFRATEDGAHRIIGTSFSNNETGAFTLTIREQ